MAASDQVASRRLRLLVGCVVLAAGGALVWAAAGLREPLPLWWPLLFAGLVAVAGCGTVYVWTRSQHQVTTTTGAILAAVVVLPPQWAVVATAAGVALAKAVRRQQPVKAVFNTGKETLGAAAAAAAASVAGLVPVSVYDGASATGWSGWVVGLAAAAVGYALVDEVLPVWAIALASGTRWRTVAARAADVRLAARGVDVLAAAATVAVVVVDVRLVVLVPAGMAIAYLTYRHRLGVREERAAWQRLAGATDALAAASIDGDLTKVLHTAAVQAGVLFPATVVEVGYDGRLVRGHAGTVDVDGPGRLAPPLRGPTTQATGKVRGRKRLVVRLLFPRDATVADREPHLLRTLADAAATAVRNSTASASLAELAERHRHDASHDPLTGLPNRRHLAEHTTGLLERADGGVVALALVDLDHFKEVNDTLGHAAGDRLLAEAALRLAAADAEAFVARLGGDEFAVVYTVTGMAAAVRRAETILAALRDPVDLDGVPVGLDASAGLAVASDHTLGYGELLRRADVAMYRAKGSPRPPRLACYAPALDRSEAGVLVVRTEVPRAAATGAWELRYQPVVDLATGRVVAADVSTRWHHRDLDQLPPGRCLGILERAGLAQAFVAGLLDRALAAAALWSAHGFDLAVVVPLTPAAVAGRDLEATIHTALRAHRVAPGRLVLALTDTTTVGHDGPVDAHLAGLREAGVRITVDGAASATLAALCDLPADELRIAARFTGDASAKAAAVVAAVAGLGRRFGLPVTAEGIVQHGHRQAMWELGCTLGTGPLFARPMTADALLRLLRRNPAGRGVISRPLQQDGAVIRLVPRREQATGPS